MTKTCPEVSQFKGVPIGQTGGQFDREESQLKGVPNGQTGGQFDYQNK